MSTIDVGRGPAMREGEEVVESRLDSTSQFHEKEDEGGGGAILAPLQQGKQELDAYATLTQEVEEVLKVIQELSDTMRLNRIPGSCRCSSSSSCQPGSCSIDVKGNHSTTSDSDYVDGRNLGRMAPTSGGEKKPSHQTVGVMKDGYADSVTTLSQETALHWADTLEVLKQRIHGSLISYGRYIMGGRPTPNEGKGATGALDVEEDLGVGEGNPLGVMGGVSHIERQKQKKVQLPLLSNPANKYVSPRSSKFTTLIKAAALANDSQLGASSDVSSNTTTRERRGSGSTSIDSSLLVDERSEGPSSGLLKPADYSSSLQAFVPQLPDLRQLSISPRDPASNSPTSSYAVGLKSTRSISTMDKEQRKKFTDDQVEGKIKYKIGNIIGSGAHGTVHSALIEATGESVAAKKIVFNEMESDEMVDEKLKSLQVEVNLLKALEHPNIVRYLFADKIVGPPRGVAIFMEHVSGGSITQVISEFGALPERTAAIFTAQLLFGLDYLHEKGVAHRDIKPANCLVSALGDVKLGDFGTATLFEIEGSTPEEASKGLEAVPQGLTGTCGTPFYMAPEVVRQESDRCHWQCDIWSLGCTVMEMLTGNNPFHHIGNNPAKVLGYLGYCQPGDPISLQPLAGSISPVALDFLSHCCPSDPAQRPSAAVLLHHPWFTTFDIVEQMPPVQFVPPAAATEITTGSITTVLPFATFTEDGGSVTDVAPISTFFEKIPVLTTEQTATVAEANVQEGKLPVEHHQQQFQRSLLQPPTSAVPPAQVQHVTSLLGGVSPNPSGSFAGDAYRRSSTEPRGSGCSTTGSASLSTAYNSLLSGTGGSGPNGSPGGLFQIHPTASPEGSITSGGGGNGHLSTPNPGFGSMSSIGALGGTLTSCVLPGVSVSSMQGMRRMKLKKEIKEEAALTVGSAKRMSSSGGNSSSVHNRKSASGSTISGGGISIVSPLNNQCSEEK